MERHSDWHYVNRPLISHPRAQDHDSQDAGQLEKQLIALTATLGSHDSSALAAAKRSYALPWLIHLVADAHQPLHVVDADAAWLAPEGDTRVFDASFPHRQIKNLHAFWDDLPGPSSLSGERLDSACRALAALHPPPGASGPQQWIDESLDIARNSGFPPGYSQTPQISPAFYQSAREIANQRIATAGYRLADLLNRQLK